MSDINITINGGTNQILPNATEAKQIFIGDQFAEKLLSENSPMEESLPEVDKLSIYINKENIPGYLAQIGECQTATELAKVVVEMAEREPRLTAEEIVKERFISQLLPFAFKLTKGRTVDNVRARINDAWMKRPKRRM
ncbi:MAG: hypothetical protein SPD54_12210 [Parabacteroides sp.]|nr:hypothetical protein [Parabacteroides sp.]